MFNNKRISLFTIHLTAADRCITFSIFPERNIKLCHWVYMLMHTNSCLPTAPEPQIISLVRQLHETIGGLKSQFQSSLNPLPTLAFSMPLETLPRQHGRPWPVPLSSRPPCGCGQWSGLHEEPGQNTVSVMSLQFALDAGKSGLKRVANLKKTS